MDIVRACQAFVAVSRHGSFTIGAAAAGMPQSVASRRIAALEEHFGAKLFDRSSRNVTLTPFGRDMLSSARRLVELVEAMEHDAERAKQRPFRLALPAVSALRRLTGLVAEARRYDLNLTLHPAGPGERAELARTLEVRAAIVAVPGDRAPWRIPLGLAGHAETAGQAIYLESLRAGRAGRTTHRRHVWIQPEDDVPHIRDHVIRLRDQVGLQPAQVVVSTSLVDAGAEVLGSADLLLCSAAQASELGLHWRPIGELRLVRGYDIAAGLREDAQRIRALPPATIGRCLGMPKHDSHGSDESDAGEA
ncbi:LysR family transcriptional regulator [Micromonospora polyrhachis]|uniref:DNA-binding transcriptional LysR family regulator n=1 Tax=Micromonospora polyrhachis TaxID=1282883 RepID=A0A7W7SU68_9ACTN|nr:LysR family transcriptional regulator [Micromonospora polyrhachis]MBB4960989.1 DNA-binding transcriptional LysR family regulator [Micromonospora polyrhachis]